MNNKVGFALSALIILGAGVFLYLNNLPDSTPTATVAAQSVAIEKPEQRHPVIRDLPAPGAIPESTEQVEPQEPVVEIIQPPKELSGSDDLFRFAVEAMTNQAVQWLTPDEQIRKWVLLVDNVANNKVPIKNRPLEFQLPPLNLESSGEMTRLGNNTERTSILIDAFTNVDTTLVVHYYRAWLPTFEQAYEELGQEGDFHSRFIQAIDNVLAVDADAANDATLIQPVVYFKFADPSLEKATRLEKFLWRLGSKNTEKIKRFLKQLKDKL